GRVGEWGAAKRPSPSSPQGRPSIFRFIKENREVYSVEKMCNVLNVRGSCFYRRLVSPSLLGAQCSKAVVDKIHEAGGDSKYIYGSPTDNRSAAQKRQESVKKLCARLTQHHGIRSKVKKK